MDDSSIYSDNELETVEESVIDSFVERAEVFGLISLNVGQVTAFQPYPGETEHAAVLRLRKYAAQHFRMTGHAISFHTDGNCITMRRIPDGCLGRLSAWTSLRIGEAMIWEPDSDSTFDEAWTKAGRIARVLNNRGLGTFYVFEADNDDHIFVRRIA